MKRRWWAARCQVCGHSEAEAADSRVGRRWRRRRGRHRRDGRPRSAVFLGSNVRDCRGRWRQLLAAGREQANFASSPSLDSMGSREHRRCDTDSTEAGGDFKRAMGAWR